MAKIYTKAEQERKANKALDNAGVFMKSEVFKVALEQDPALKKAFTHISSIPTDTIQQLEEQSNRSKKEAEKNKGRPRRGEAIKELIKHAFKQVKEKEPYFDDMKKIAVARAVIKYLKDNHDSELPPLFEFEGFEAYVDGDKIIQPAHDNQIEKSTPIKSPKNFTTTLKDLKLIK